MPTIEFIDTSKPGVSDEEIKKSIIIKRGTGSPLNQIELDYLAKQRQEDHDENEKNFKR